MDAIDNPDHGRQVYTAHGITVVNNPYNPGDAKPDAAIAPAGGPVFPATEDVQISSTPT